MQRPLPASPRAHAKRSVVLVESALIGKVTLPSKPGLVDVHGNGAHHDLDWTLMAHSAQAPRPMFETMALAGAQIEMWVDAQPALRERIGRLGREGETAMLKVTGGVNAHRGAIWALGLLAMAAAQTSPATDVVAVARRTAHLASIPDRSTPVSTSHKGRCVCNGYGVGGTKGQVYADFPHAIKMALPALCETRAADIRKDHTRVDASLAIMTVLDNTCVLAHDGAKALHVVQTGAATVCAEGGLATAQDRRAFRMLRQDMLTLRVSPGGVASSLAMALFLDRLPANMYVMSDTESARQETEHGTS